MRAYDNFGNIILVKFPDNFSLKEKKKFAEKILKKQKSVKTVLEKKEKIKGRLRKLSTNYIAGEKTKEVLYRENNCVFRFNIDCCYFSPRLSNERKEIASKVKKEEIVLVMFAGVAPYSIAIAKLSKAKKIFSSSYLRILETSPLAPFCTISSTVPQSWYGSRWQFFRCLWCFFRHH